MTIVLLTNVRFTLQVAGVGSEKGNRNLPQIAIESGLGGGHLAEGKYYVKTKELVQDMEQHFGDQQGTSRESYAIISVWRNGINIGTIEKIRAKHHLWELCVRHWARKYDKKEYAGKINKKTGKYYPSPALGKRRRAKKDEE